MRSIGLLEVIPARRLKVMTVPEARELRTKRFLDLILSMTMAIFAIPVSAVIALAIKWEDGGPIFYRQERWGKGGGRFRAYKFRTMIPRSDEIFGIKQASQNDPRVTSVGRILRATGLDELPQIINIFRGEMSFVGPRALAVGEVIHAINGQKVDYETLPEFWKRLGVKPGLTGLPTVYLPKDISPKSKFRYDLVYIRKQSLGLDLRLIFLSFWISFRGKWETRGKKV